MNPERLGLLALALIGCTVNGKSLFSLGGASASSTPIPTTSSSSPPMGAIPATVAAPASYAWCKDLKENQQEFTDHLATSQAADDAHQAPTAIAQGLCYPDAYAPPDRGKLEANRLRWMQRFAMTEADWARDIPAWSNEGGSARAYLIYQGFPARSKQLATMPPLDQFASIPNDASVFPWLVDALPPTEAGRLALLRNCVRMDKPALLLLCADDVTRFDLAGLGKELAADTTHDARDRMILRTVAVQTVAAFPQLTAKLAEVAARDEDFTKALATIKAGRARWDAERAGRAAVLATLLALDEAEVTGKPAPACADQVMPAFHAALAKIPATTFKGVHGDSTMGSYFPALAASLLAHDPDVWLAATLAVRCPGFDDDGLEHAFEDALPETNFRGPRGAARQALFAATTTAPHARPRPTEEYEGAPVGTIASVTELGATVKITFVPRPKYQATVCDGVRRLARHEPDRSHRRQRRRPLRAGMHPPPAGHHRSVGGPPRDLEALRRRPREGPLGRDLA